MKYLFELYISGKSGRSLRAVRNIEEISRMFPKAEYDVKIIDIQKDPRSAVEERIVAVPTLVRKCPPPSCRIVGDLSAIQDVIYKLNLKQEERSPR